MTKLTEKPLNLTTLTTYGGDLGGNFSLRLALVIEGVTQVTIRTHVLTGSKKLIRIAQRQWHRVELSMHIGYGLFGMFTGLY